MQNERLKCLKCTKYRAKRKVNMPKCRKRHAKWQILVPNCCKRQANFTRKEIIKRTKPHQKKLKLFFTPFKYDRRYFFKKSSLFNAGGWNTCLFGYHVALCVHSDDYVDCLPWLPSANHFRGLRNMHPKRWKVQQWTSRNYRHDPKLWKWDMFDWFSLNLWIPSGNLT